MFCPKEEGTQQKVIRLSHLCSFKSPKGKETHPAHVKASFVKLVFCKLEQKNNCHHNMNERAALPKQMQTPQLIFL